MASQDEPPATGAIPPGENPHPEPPAPPSTRERRGPPAQAPSSDAPSPGPERSARPTAPPLALHDGLEQPLAARRRSCIHPRIDTLAASSSSSRAPQGPSVPPPGARAVGRPRSLGGPLRTGLPDADSNVLDDRDRNPFRSYQTIKRFVLAARATRDDLVERDAGRRSRQSFHGKRDPPQWAQVRGWSRQEPGAQIASADSNVSWDPADQPRMTTPSPKTCFLIRKPSSQH